MSKAFKYLFLVVGVGGTGGNFAKELCRLISGYNDRNNVSIVFIDGDVIEKKNTSRQPYAEEEISNNKATVLAEKCSDTFGIDIIGVPHYITDKDRLLNIISSFSINNYSYTTIPIIIGCVDNHKCRKIMHESFETLQNIIYIDSGNEDVYGEVVCGIKLNNVVVAPDKIHYSKEILTDNSVGKDEESCEVINSKNIQHLVTNLQASNIILSFVTDLLILEKLKGGIVYFDVSRKYQRFDAYKGDSDDVGC